MSKKDIPKGVEGHSVGSRTSRRHDATAWDNVDRKDDTDEAPPFDPKLAAERGRRFVERQQKKGN
jgi:hypothetical protein